MTTSYYSTVLQHPADRVWAALRDFNGLATWFSGAVSESHIEDGLSGLTIGAVRSFQMGDSRIRNACAPCPTLTAATPMNSANRHRFPSRGI